MVLLLTIGDLHIPLRTHDLPSKFKKLLVPGKIGQIVCTGNVCDRETWEYLRTVAPDVRGVRGDYDETPNLPPSLVVQHGPLRIGVAHGHQIVPLGDTEALAAAARKLDVDVLVTGATHRFEAFEFESKFFINPGSATGAFTPTWPISPPVPAGQTTGNAQSTGEPAATASSSTQESEPTGSPKPGKEGDGSNSDENGLKNSQENTAPPAPANGAPSKTQSEPNPDETATPEIESQYPPGPIPSFALLDIQGPVVVTYVYRLVDGDVKVEKFEYRKEMPA